MYDVDQEETNLEIEEALEFLFDRIEAGQCVTSKKLNSEYSDITQALKRYDLIVIDHNDEIKFTEKGNIQGIKVIRRHRLAERLFHDLLQIENDLLENTACEFEHTIKKEVEQRVCALLGHPRLCPHNKKIPPGVCCKKRLNVKKIITPLVEMKAGEKGNIAYLNTLNEAVLEKLLAIGVLPSEPVEILKTSPSWAVKIGMSQFAFDSEIASNIFVRLSDDAL
ncbi:MAG: metal-dependent transcriptional regulator [Candidatus Odinarchaeota archaeon]